MDQLLHSGKILFNDPISKYVEEVADILLAKNPEIRKKLRFYTVRSSSVNAFTSNEGIILINLGLLATLENEAQLAYILSHEITHFVDQHPLDIYLNNQEIYTRTQSSDFQYQAYQRAITETNTYSKEKEEEADLKGLNIYTKSNYSLWAAVEVFDILRNSAEPFAQADFHPSLFDIPYLKLPDSIFFDSRPNLNEINSQKIFRQQTHPNPKRRQILVRRKVRKMNHEGRKKFILSPDRFYKLQRRCRFEMVRQYMLEKQFERGIYSAFTLLEKYPESPFLTKEIGFALYGLANYANYGRFWDVHLDFEEKNAPENRLYYFFSGLMDEELNLMAILYNWNLLKNQPSRRTEKCLQALIHQFGKAFYSKGYFLKVDEKKSLSLFKDGLEKVMEEKEFKNFFTKALKRDPYIQSIKNYGNSTNEFLDPKKQKLQGYKFGIDQVVFLDPFFQHYDDRKEVKMDYFKSEDSKKKLLSLINTYSDNFGIETKVISPTSFDENQVSTFNDMSLFKLWITEKGQHERMNWVGLYYDDILYLQEKYNTPYVVSLGGIGIKQDRKSKTLTLGAGFLFPPILPYSLFYTFTPQQDFLLYAIIYDIQSDSSNSVLSKRIRMKASESVLNSQVYDFFLQLHLKSGE